MFTPVSGNPKSGKTILAVGEVFGHAADDARGIEIVASATVRRRRLALAEGQTADRTAELIECAAGQVEPGTEIVLVSTRPVDLGDTERFAHLRADPARRAALQTVRVIDTSSDDLGKYFQC